MKEKYKYLLNNVFLFTIANFGTKILSFLFVGVYTAALTTSEYGIVALITTTASFISPFISLNIYSAIQRFAADDNYDRKKVVTVSMYCGLFSTAALLVVVGIIASLHIFNWSRYYYIFLIIDVLASNLFECCLAFCRAIDKVKAVVAASLISTIVTISSNILFLIVFKWGIKGYLISILNGILIPSIFLFFAGGIYKYISVALPDREVATRMLRFSIPLIFNGLAWLIVSGADRFFIARMIGDDANGVYTVSAKIPDILQTLLNVFNQAWGLTILREINGDKQESAKFFSKIYMLLNAVVLIGATFVVIMVIPFATFLFKGEFFVAWRYSGLLLVATAMNGISSTLGGVFDYAGDTKPYAYSTVVAAICNMALNALLIPSFGIMGAVIATDISFFTIWAVRYFLSRKHMKLQIDHVRLLFCYGLLLAQIVLSLLGDHHYILQAVIIVTITFTLREYIVSIWQNIVVKLLHRNKV